MLTIDWLYTSSVVTSVQEFEFERACDCRSVKTLDIVERAEVLMRSGLSI